MALAPRLVAQLLSPRRPATVILMPTDRCNCGCATCSNPRVGHSDGSRGGELSLDEYTELARTSGPFLQVALGGGEPFLRSDLTEIVQTLYEHAQVGLFSIPTNGSQVASTVARVEAVTRRCPRSTFNLMVSIDALGDRHDVARGRAGLFDSALELCHELLRLRRSRRNLNVVINTTICEHNLEDIPDLCAFLAQEFAGQPLLHNTSFDHRIDARLFSERRPLEKTLEFERQSTYRQLTTGGSLSDRLISRLYVDLVNAMLMRQRLAGRMLYRCNAGSKLFVVLSDGTVGPCEPILFEPRYRDFPRINIRDHGFDYRRVREEPGYREMLAFIDRGDCHACPWSCAAITSLLYDPRNWANLLTTPSAATVIERALHRRNGSD